MPNIDLKASGPKEQVISIIVDVLLRFHECFTVSSTCDRVFLILTLLGCGSSFSVPLIILCIFPQSE